MRRVILVLLGLIILAGMVTADATDLSNSTISSSNSGWLVANGVDQSTITVVAISPSGPVSGALVTFSVSDPALGTLSSSNVTTGSTGTATSKFTTAHRSGSGTITAVITDGSTVYTLPSVTVNIDHNTLANATYTKADQVPAGSVTQLNATFIDGWGNPIDNKNPAETHTITLQMNGDGGSGLWDGSAYVTQLSVPTDAHGNVSVNIRVSSEAGSNAITVASGSYFKVEYIDGVATTPVSMSQTVIPDSPDTCDSYTSCPVDGTHPFNLYYTVLDRYSNPVKNTNVTVTATQGTTNIVTGTIITNSSGVAYTQFSEDLIGTYTITSRSVSNSSIVCTNPSSTGYCSQDVEYYATDPVDMQLIVSPEVMVSHDANASSYSTLMARVMDSKGNPVETYHGVPMNVTFTINHPDDTNVDGTFFESANSSFSTTSLVSTTKADMGADGFATVLFYPGSFVTYGVDGYNSTATAQVTVTASWTTPSGNIINRTSTLVWKNYPYLSITSSASSTNAKVGDNLLVTIRIAGDGAALQPKPIQAVLCIDRSGSMLYDKPDRMYSIREAAKTFIDNMSSKDSVALVTFGQKGPINTPGQASGLTSQINNVYITPKTYANYATVDKSLTLLNPTVNPSAVSDLKSALMGIVPDYGTPMREALKDSIQALPTSTSSGTVQAIILLSDGDYNFYGDPLARGHGYSSSQYGPTAYGDLDTDYMSYSGVTNQNMALYAKDRGIKIYSIAYGSSLSSGGKTTLSTLATSSGGKYYTASAANIADVYKQIAGELNVEAGGNTTMEMDLGTIIVDNTTISNVNQYLSYIYSLPVSTYIDKSNTNSSGTYVYAGFPNYRNDTQNWTLYKELDFNVGTIVLNDTWQTSFMFNLTHNGTLVLFGPGTGSLVSFTDSSTNKTTTGFIPSLLIQVRNSSGTTGLGGNTLTVDDMTKTSSSDPNIIRVQWTTTYTGTTAADGSVKEKVQYCSRSTGSCSVSTDWHQYTELPSMSGPLDAYRSDPLPIDTTGWAVGEYFIRVYAVADDAADSYATVPYTKNSLGGSYIKLE